MWKDILTLPVLPKFTKLAEEFERFLEDYKMVFDSPDPHKQPLPEHWNEDLDEFQKMLVLKCVRADKITNAMQVAKYMVCLTLLDSDYSSQGVTPPQS
jgi:dynein heavy chain